MGAACHGADRGLRLVLTRLMGRGCLAEALAGSNELVSSDRFFRRLGFVGLAQTRARSSA